MSQLSSNEMQTIKTAQERFRGFLDQSGISLQLRKRLFDMYSIRAAHGDSHLNQAFDPRSYKIWPG